MQLYSTCEEALALVDDRPKFGSEFMEGSFLYNIQTDRHTIKQMLEPALIYAFDYFFCNRDRNNQKPNLLIKQMEGYLIDHEMGLEISTDTLENFNREFGILVTKTICFITI